MAYGGLIVAAGRWLARLTAAMGVILSMAAAVCAADVFTASVPVEVKASSAMEARERAIAEAEAKAHRLVLQRLTRRADWRSLPRSSGKGVVDDVQSFELRDERTAPTTYAATVVVHFRPSAIRRLLQRARIPFSETTSRPVLVLPVYEWNGRRVLFENPNPWRDAWARRNPEDALVPLQVPRGDATDREAVSADQALAGDTDRLLAFARRYGVGAVIVAHAVHTADASGGHPVLDVTATRYGEGAGAAPISEHVVGGASESIDALADRTTQQIADDVDDAWKAITIVTGDQPEESLEVEVPLTGLVNLAEVQRRLAEVPAVRRRELTMIERDAVRLRLGYVGGIERLRVALAQSGLDLTQAGPAPGDAAAPLPGGVPAGPQGGGPQAGVPFGAQQGGPPGIPPGGPAGAESGAPFGAPPAPGWILRPAGAAGR